MQKNIFNLDDSYEITVVNNKIYWVTAEEWPSLELRSLHGFDHLKIFTEYRRGECEIVDDILVLKKANRVNRVEEPIDNFWEGLLGHPKWDATTYVVSSMEGLPEIKSCNHGDNISLITSLVIMQKLGYSWNHETVKFDKIEQVMEVENV